MLCQFLSESAGHFWWLVECENMANPDYQNIKQLQTPGHLPLTAPIIFRNETTLLIFGTKITLSKFSCRKHIGTSVCLTPGVTILASTTEIKLFLSYKYNVVAPLWSANASINCRTALVFLTDLYMHIIFILADSEDTAGWTWTFHHTETSIRVWIIPETNRPLLRILKWSTSWCHSK